MLQLDGSPHRWFGNSSSCLLNLIDDASSLNLCRFDHPETVRAACLLLWAWMRRHGIPQSIYRDRRNSYFATDLTSSDGLFGQFCRRLIPAFSPQGKGRVERSNQTHQQRLIPQLRLAMVLTLQQASAFLPRYLAAARQPLPLRAAFELYCDAEFTRKVANDWTVRFAGKTYQLLPNHSFRGSPR
jgi:hypothetical protein